MDPVADDLCKVNFVERTRYLFVDVAQAGAIATGARPVRRAVFRKTHGVVYARLNLDPTRPQALRVGLFAGDSYEAWVRFSSDVAPTQSDAGMGTIGIGIKLFSVRPPTLASLDPQSPTGDLILQNHDVFFVDTGPDMCSFTDLALKGRDNEWYATHPRTKEILAEMQKREESVLTTALWSVLPYACGDLAAVKYRLMPRSTGTCLSPDSDANRLRSDLKQRLLAGSATFDFALQIPRDGVSLPVDEATVRWEEADAPFTVIGTLDIPKQDVDIEGQETYGDTLAFSPWRVPEANRPLGSIAESRRAAYPSSAAARHRVNGTPDAEPHIPRKP
jgi:hypothetical protein